MSASPWETLPPPAAEAPRAGPRPGGRRPRPAAGAPRAGAGLTPAGWWSRVGATIADNLLIAIPAWIVIGVIGVARFGSLGGNALIALVALAYAVLMLTYHHGQTVGKQATSIRVLAEDGQPVGAGRAFGRELLKVVFRLHRHHLPDRRPLAALAVREPRAPRPRRGDARREPGRRRPA